MFYFRGDILYTPRNTITEDIMKRVNKSFQTFEDFRSFSQPYGSLYYHLKHIESYETQAELLTILLSSRFYQEYSQSNIGQVYGVDFTQFINSNVTGFYEDLKNNMNVFQITNQVTR